MIYYWEKIKLALLLLTISLFIQGCKSNEAMVFKAFVPNLEVDNFIKKGVFQTIDIDKLDETLIYDKNTHAPITLKIEDCSNSKWYCFSGGGSSFAIEKSWRGDVTEWNHLGYSYHLLDKKNSESSLNSDLFFIAAYPTEHYQDDDFSKIYIYSIKDGIVGIILFMLLIDEIDKVLPITYFRVR